MLDSKSILKIKAELESNGIPSPSGNAQWCKRTIGTMLSNEKYYGDVMVLKTYSSGFPVNRRVRNSGIEDSHPIYLVERHHEAIISREMFDAVQSEKRIRSNVELDESGRRKRSSIRYKSK